MVWLKSIFSFWNLLMQVQAFWWIAPAVFISSTGIPFSLLIGSVWCDFWRNRAGESRAEKDVREKLTGVNLWPSGQRTFHSAPSLPSSLSCFKEYKKYSLTALASLQRVCVRRVGKIHACLDTPHTSFNRRLLLPKVKVILIYGCWNLARDSFHS